jgi:hypothetical protein
MSNPVWPPSLPQSPLLDGYKEKPPKLFARAEMDAGVPKMRRRFTNAVRPVEVTFYMTQAQVETLDAFYLSTIQGGAVAFDWRHPRTGITKAWRFVAEPEYEPASGVEKWRVTCQLEVKP